MSVIFVLNRVVAVMGKRVQKKDLAAGDKRLGVLGEVIVGIRAIKFMAWEGPFLNAIDAVRQRETELLFQYRLLTIVSVTAGRASPVLAACATFVYMASSGQGLGAAQVFSALSAFQALRMPLIIIPLIMVQVSTQKDTYSRREALWARALFGWGKEGGGWLSFTLHHLTAFTHRALTQHQCMCLSLLPPPLLRPLLPVEDDGRFIGANHAVHAPPRAPRACRPSRPRRVRRPRRKWFL